MNKQRRQDIERAAALLAEARGILETALADEQEFFDNMPEAFQAGERGEKAEAAASALDTAVSAIEEAAAELETATE